jgi:hypothetical protein
VPLDNKLTARRSSTWSSWRSRWRQASFWAGFDERGRAGVSAGMGLVMGESQIWLQPMGAIDALERYNRGALVGAAAGRPLLVVQPAAQGAGLALSVVF